MSDDTQTYAKVYTLEETATKLGISTKTLWTQYVAKKLIEPCFTEGAIKEFKSRQVKRGQFKKPRPKPALELRVVELEKQLSILKQAQTAQRRIVRRMAIEIDMDIEDLPE